MKAYALEASHLARLLAGRRELLATARALGTAEAMREAREDLMRQATIYRAPGRGERFALDIDEDGVAHIPIVGELTPSADPCGAYAMRAETEYGYIRAALSAAEAHPNVSAIALDVDSPGGYISGLDETAQALAAVSKPTVAYVGSMAASAAYWLASQADRIVALSPASEIGSIGIACEEYDEDEALAREGVAHRVYTSTDAPDKRPDTKTDEGRAKIIAELDALHAVFVRRVAEGRGVPAATVSKDFGRGGVLTAEAAQAAGMIDEVIGSHLSRERTRAAIATARAAEAAAEAATVAEARRRAAQAAARAQIQAAVTAAAEAAKKKAALAESARKLAALGVPVTEGASEDELRTATHDFLMQQLRRHA